MGTTVSIIMQKIYACVPNPRPATSSNTRLLPCNHTSETASHNLPPFTSDMQATNKLLLPCTSHDSTLMVKINSHHWTLLSLPAMSVAVQCSFHFILFSLVVLMCLLQQKFRLKVTPETLKCNSIPPIPGLGLSSSNEWPTIAVETTISSTLARQVGNTYVKNAIEKKPKSSRITLAEYRDSGKLDVPSVKECDLSGNASAPLQEVSIVTLLEPSNLPLLEISNLDLTNLSRTPRAKQFAAQPPENEKTLEYEGKDEVLRNFIKLYQQPMFYERTHLGKDPILEEKENMDDSNANTSSWTPMSPPDLGNYFRLHIARTRACHPLYSPLYSKFEKSTSTLDSSANESGCAGYTSLFSFTESLSSERGHNSLQPDGWGIYPTLFLDGLLVDPKTISDSMLHINSIKRLAYAVAIDLSALSVNNQTKTSIQSCKEFAHSHLSDWCALISQQVSDEAALCMVRLVRNVMVYAECETLTTGQYTQCLYSMCCLTLENSRFQYSALRECIVQVVIALDIASVKAALIPVLSSVFSEGPENYWQQAVILASVCEYFSVHHAQMNGLLANEVVTTVRQKVRQLKRVNGGGTVLVQELLQLSMVVNRIIVDKSVDLVEHNSIEWDGLQQACFKACGKMGLDNVVAELNTKINNEKSNRKQMTEICRKTFSRYKLATLSKVSGSSTPSPIDRLPNSTVESESGDES